jgi:putative phosphoesterase
MKRIGILSDTHSHLDPKIFTHFIDVDEIWHAGDIGDIEVLDKLRAFKPTRAVYGNIDNHVIRQETPEFDVFTIENKKVLITHIAGKPGKYSKPLFDKLQIEKPDIVVCGHSHILLVQFDKLSNLLWINPGACGIKGFHSVRTIIRCTLNADKVENFEVIELGKRV